MLAKIGDITRFPTARKLASWAGLTPTFRGSDLKVRHVHIAKQGASSSPRSRPSRQATRSDSPGAARSVRLPLPLVACTAGALTHNAATRRAVRPPRSSTEARMGGRSGTPQSPGDALRRPDLHADERATCFWFRGLPSTMFWASLQSKRSGAPAAAWRSARGLCSAVRLGHPSSRGLEDGWGCYAGGPGGWCQTGRSPDVSDSGSGRSYPEPDPGGFR